MRKVRSYVNANVSVSLIFKNGQFFSEVSLFLSQKFSHQRHSAKCELLRLYFSILIHENTKSTTVLCIYNIMEERPKPFLKIYLTDLDSVYHHKEKTITFHQFLINCGEKSQGRPNSVLKWCPRGPRDVRRTSIWKYIIKHIIVVLFSISYLSTKCIAGNTEKLIIAYSHSFGEESYGRSPNVPKNIHRVTSLGRPQGVNNELLAHSCTCIFIAL